MSGLAIRTSRVRGRFTPWWRPIAAAGAGLLLAACSLGIGGGGDAPDASAPGTEARTGERVKVALLLPLGAQGNTGTLGKSLKQAGELALFDFDNPNIELISKDTKGTGAGAREAARAAIDEGAELIIGPILAEEVSGAAPVARGAGVSMVAFSSDRKVAGDGVYLLSFLPGRDVSRIVSFAASREKRNFAALIPNNAYGRLVETELNRAVADAGGRVVVQADYPPGDANGMLEPARRVGAAIRDGQGVDVLFLPASQDDLASIGPQLAAAGIEPGKVQLIGTGRWDFPSIAQERALAGGWYPAPDPKGWRGFTQRYVETYGGVPPRLASLAYDGISLAVSLSSNAPGSRYTAQQLTRASGFNGIDGLFRLLSDGTSERGLAILEVQNFGPRVIDAPPSAFANAQY